ncbi:MAG: Flp family type IVb pilin [Proteobacteria bacterium]|nr:Flp family type IVb pilin [Pseudomonadota bacterium]
MVELIKFLKDDTGATAIEYALIASLVSIFGIVGYSASGNVVTSAFVDIADVICTQVGGSFTLTATGENSCTF